jgi:NhaA family Na+:H+ antiporter
MPTVGPPRRCGCAMASPPHRVSSPPQLPPPPESWRPARVVARRALSPIRRFLAIEASSGLLLLGAALVALALANSPWAGGYDAFWHTELRVAIGSWEVSRSLHFIVNDVLMAIFFFVVGLEIRREVHAGELSDLRRAALPIAAALGGMLVPAAIYAILNHGGPGQAGWGIPMATDIAFAVGVVTVLGSRVSPALRVLLLALAVIDDLGAILVIAIFYSDGVAPAWLGISALGLAAVWLVRASGTRSLWAYAAPGVVVWLGLYLGGVHPTLAGVLLGLVTPVATWLGVDGLRRARGELDEVIAADPADQLERLDAVQTACREAVSPSIYLQHRLHGVVAYLIMPLFALANAGVAIRGELGGGAGTVLLGIVLGLVVGKLLGVFGAAWLASRLGLATRPRGVGDRGLLLVASVAGIGFTMSLFVAQLALPPGPLLDAAKLAILIASGLAMVLGGVLGVALLPRPAGPDDDVVDEQVAERSLDE